MKNKNIKKDPLINAMDKLVFYLRILVFLFAFFVGVILIK